MFKNKNFGDIKPLRDHPEVAAAWNKLSELEKELEVIRQKQLAADKAGPVDVGPTAAANDDADHILAGEPLRDVPTNPNQDLLRRRRAFEKAIEKQRGIVSKIENETALENFDQIGPPCRGHIENIITAAEAFIEAVTAADNFFGNLKRLGYDDHRRPGGCLVWPVERTLISQMNLYIDNRKSSVGIETKRRKKA